MKIGRTTANWHYTHVSTGNDIVSSKTGEKHYGHVEEGFVLRNNT